MTELTIPRIVIPASLSLLPEKMNTHSATVMLVAIGLQESRFIYRRQKKGPARGFWQFESGGGLRGVMTHHATKQHAIDVLRVLNYPLRPRSLIHEALADNDILAASFARLLLYTDPRPLPEPDDEPELWWRYYLRNWRPGKPHRHTWDRFFKLATMET